MSGPEARAVAPPAGTAVAGVAGAVLCGGASRRMGADKALCTVGGVPLVRRVANALAAGGAHPVVTVGGDRQALAHQVPGGLDDLVPGSGPVGGVATALCWAHQLGAAVVLVAACDHPDLDPVLLRRLATAVATPAPAGLPAVAVATADGARAPTVAAWRVEVCLPMAQAALGAGRLRLGALIDAAADIGAGVIEMDSCPGVVADLDTPADLAARRRAEPAEPLPSPRRSAPGPGAR